MSDFERTFREAEAQAWRTGHEVASSSSYILTIGIVLLGISAAVVLGMWFGLNMRPDLGSFCG